MLLYSRSHHHNKLQKLFGIYFKFRGLLAKGFDTLHSLALTMSHKWTGNTVARISRTAMEEVRSQIEHFPWILSYDNVQIPFCVFSQRLDNQGEFGNGTAATVYINRKATPLPSTANHNLQEKHREGQKNPLDMLDIMDLAAESHPRLQRHIVYQVLRFLLEAPEFNRATYRNKDSHIGKLQCVE
jgi:hypothetical protein